MLSYTQFLFETSFKYESGDHGYGPFHRYSHDHGKVKIHFSHHEEDPHDHYDVGYTVNDSHDRERSYTHGEEGRKILHHVHKTIHHFIKEKKPSSLSFQPHDEDDDSRDKKENVYHKLAHHLARHYGGKVHHDGGSTVRFNH